MLKYFFKNKFHINRNNHLNTLFYKININLNKVSSKEIVITVTKLRFQIAVILTWRHNIKDSGYGQCINQPKGHGTHCIFIFPIHRNKLLILSDCRDISPTHQLWRINKRLPLTEIPPIQLQYICILMHPLPMRWHTDKIGIERYCDNKHILYRRIVSVIEYRAD